MFCDPLAFQIAFAALHNVKACLVVLPFHSRNTFNIAVFNLIFAVKQFTHMTFSTVISSPLVGAGMRILIQGLSNPLFHILDPSRVRRYSIRKPIYQKVGLGFIDNRGSVAQWGPGGVLELSRMA